MIDWNTLDRLHERYAPAKAEGFFTVKEYVQRHKAQSLSTTAAMSILDRMVRDGILECAKALVDNRHQKVYRIPPCAITPQKPSPIGTSGKTGNKRTGG